MDRPSPDEIQPPITVWGQVWRVLGMLAISAVVWVQVVERQSSLQFALDLGLGVVSYGLIFLRRRWPFAIALLLTGVAGFSGLAAGPSTLAAASLATRRIWWQLVPLGVLAVVLAQVFAMTQPLPTEDPIWLTLSVNTAVTLAVLAWGMYIGSRRELVWSLRQRAERAEAEQGLRVAQARANERARIAREMHDVLAHRISQIAMHAGALGFREDLDADRLRQGSREIQVHAHEALTDLRDVLGVLRDTRTGELLDRPQPTYADLVVLVADAQAAGLNVSFHEVLAAPAEVPDAGGRTVYRIVQEGITNVRKHAPGARLEIAVAGSVEDGVSVELRNPVGFGPTATPGSGLGLVGLSERAELRGGRLEHRHEGATFVLRGWIPWAA